MDWWHQCGCVNACLFTAVLFTAVLFTVRLRECVLEAAGGGERAPPDGALRDRGPPALVLVKEGLARGRSDNLMQRVRGRKRRGRPVGDHEGAPLHECEVDIVRARTLLPIPLGDIGAKYTGVES